jgi:hypothetical protein
MDLPHPALIARVSRQEIRLEARQVVELDGHSAHATQSLYAASIVVESPETPKDGINAVPTRNNSPSPPNPHSANKQPAIVIFPAAENIPTSYSRPR